MLHNAERLMRRVHSNDTDTDAHLIAIGLTRRQNMQTIAELLGKSRSFVYRTIYDKTSKKGDDAIECFKLMFAPTPADISAYDARVTKLPPKEPGQAPTLAGHRLTTKEREKIYAVSLGRKIASDYVLTKILGKKLDTHAAAELNESVRRRVTHIVQSLDAPGTKTLAGGIQITGGAASQYLYPSNTGSAPMVPYKKITVPIPSVDDSERNSSGTERSDMITIARALRYEFDLLQTQHKSIFDTFVNGGNYLEIVIQINSKRVVHTGVTIGGSTLATHMMHPARSIAKSS